MMKLLVAFDRFDEPKYANLELSKKYSYKEYTAKVFDWVLNAVSTSIGEENLAEYPYEQFLYSLNTTIEFKIPVTASKEQISNLLNNLLEKLKPIVYFRMTVGNVIGNPNETTEQKKFAETVGNIITVTPPLKRLSFINHNNP